MFGVSQTVSRHLQQQPCSSLTGVVVFNLRHATNLAASTPQLQWLGGALVRCGEGRGPAPFFLGGGPEIVVAGICHMRSLSKRFNASRGKLAAVSVEKGSAGPKPTLAINWRGVTHVGVFS